MSYFKRLTGEIYQGEVSIYEGDTPTTKTKYDQAVAVEIESQKDTQALEAASSPALESAIEEFSAILTTAGIDIPADIKANIVARIRGKLP